MKSFTTLLLCLIAVTIVYSQNNGQVTSHETFVFVHGAWGGGWDYKVMEKLLEDKGHTVYRPTLTGLGEREHLNGPDVNLDTHIMDIVNVIKFEELSDIILVGHSYGGMVITGVADRIPGKIKRLVYADAMLPVDGESVFDLNPEDSKKFFLNLAKADEGGFAIPPFWPDPGKDVPHPLASFQQPISLGNLDAAKIPATYILTIEPGADTDNFSKYAERAKERGWNYFELPTGHNLQRTMPEEYAEILLNLGNGGK